MGLSYDFLTFMSFPSSGKIENPGPGWLYWNKEWIFVKKGRLTFRVKVKQENILNPRSQVGANVRVDGALKNLFVYALPVGTFSWTEFSYEVSLPEDLVIRAWFAGGAPGTTWFDDLKIFQDDVLVYSDDFSNWAPVIIPAEIITGVAIIKYLK